MAPSLTLDLPLARWLHTGCSTAGKAALVMNFILLISLLVGGFLVNVQSIPGWIAWLHYFSLFYYAYDILTTNEAAGLIWSIEVRGGRFQQIC